MRDILYPDPAPSDPDPVRRAQIAMQVPLPKRFYAAVAVSEVEGGYGVLLDGKPILTPAKHRLALASAAAARLVAAEWEAQADVIDLRRMPLTRLVNVGLDAVSQARASVIDDISAYAASDLVCYRATDPEGLVGMQARHWDKVLAHHAADTLGARFILSAGVMFVQQPTSSLAAVRQRLERVADPVALAALHVMTTLMGSVLISIMVLDAAITPEDAWAAAHVDEDWTNSQWGIDEEAARRRATRWADFSAAVGLLAALDR